DRIDVWDARSWKLTRKIETQANGSLSACISADGKTVAARPYHAGGKIFVADVARGKHLATLETPQTSPFGKLALPADGKFVASWFVRPDDEEKKASKTLLVWDVATKAISDRIVCAHGAVRQAGFSPDGKLLAVVTSESAVCLYQRPGYK